MPQATALLNYFPQPNVTGATIGEIEGIDYGGWDYVWVLYVPKENNDTKLVMKVPAGVWVERLPHPEQALPVLCQAPLASQVCGWGPLHCFAPGVQAPEHAPVALLQRWGQAVPLSSQAPLALQVWGCSPLHCTDVGLQEPAQAPVALLQR